MNWNTLDRETINKKVQLALSNNSDYRSGEVIGTPATYLDQKEFYPDASFLKDAPFLKTLIANPNHIGCHTLDKKSSPMFNGTQNIERELISICAEEIFRASKNTIDGYVATGGTEANIEALWVYRNYFKQEFGAKTEEIGVLFSEDTHYSITKGCDLLQIEPICLPVEQDSREIKLNRFEEQLEAASNNGIKYFIVFINVSTTMFGSVDEIDPIANSLEEKNLQYKIHLDAAFGGFIYPFTNQNSEHHFANPRVSSISIDAHKMLQTPYGTGIFLIRKGFMQYVTNSNAQYVPGLDYTLCGSRSGANAIVIWMQLMNYGSEGWTYKMEDLIQRTNYMCEQLDKLSIGYYRNPYLNIISIKASDIPATIAQKFGLVADSYEQEASWWKIVVMDHVSYDILNQFLEELKLSMTVDIT